MRIFLSCKDMGQAAGEKYCFNSSPPGSEDLARVGVQQRRRQPRRQTSRELRQPAQPRVVSCHVLSCHVTLRHVKCQVMSRHVMLRHIISSHVMSCNLESQPTCEKMVKVEVMMASMQHTDSALR